MTLPLCHYHKERHRPTHCRNCGTALTGRTWYCPEPKVEDFDGSEVPKCVAEFFALESWPRARALALTRAGGRCEECGAPAKEVHHIIPVGGGPRRGETNRQENLAVFCTTCHDRAHNPPRVYLDSPEATTARRRKRWYLTQGLPVPTREEAKHGS